MECAANTGGEKKVEKKRENFGKMSRIGLGDRTLLALVDFVDPKLTQYKHHNIITNEYIYRPA